MDIKTFMKNAGAVIGLAAPVLGFAFAVGYSVNKYDTASERIEHLETKIENVQQSINNLNVSTAVLTERVQELKLRQKIR